MNYFNDLYSDAYKRYKKEYADNKDFVLESNESAFEQLKPLYIKYKEKVFNLLRVLETNGGDEALKIIKLKIPTYISTV